MLRIVVLKYIMITNRRAGRSWDMPLTNNQIYYVPLYANVLYHQQSKRFP